MICSVRATKVDSFWTGEAVNEGDRGQVSKSERLRKELVKVRKGAGMREPGRLSACPTLIQLAATIRRRRPEDDTDPLVDAMDVLMEAAQELTSDSRRIFTTMFAIGEGRRATLAKALGVDTKTIRRREDRVLATVAYSIVEREQTIRLREAHSRLERRQPLEATLAVDWLDRFRHYYRIWTDL